MELYKIEEQHIIENMHLSFLEWLNLLNIVIMMHVFFCKWHNFIVFYRRKKLIVNIYYTSFVLSFVISTFVYVTRKRKLEWVLYVILFPLYSHIGMRWPWIIGSQLTSRACLFLISSSMAYTDLPMLSFMFGIFLLLKLFIPLIHNSLLIFTAITIVWILVLPARDSSFKL